MMKKFIYIFFLSFFPLTTFAWNALGHMIVANIAYKELKPDVRARVDTLVTYLNQEYRDMESFLHLAYWPDTLRIQKIETYTHWHYINNAFSTDGTQVKNINDTDNAVWALNTMNLVVKNAKANPYERARFLAFFVHIVGDLHQPLHAVSYISAQHPDGDRGGNSYHVRHNNQNTSLHKIWDAGLGAFEGQNSTNRVNVLTDNIMARYPRAYFGKQVDDLNPSNWSQEGIENAKAYVYNTPENQAINSHYIQTAKDKSEEQVALAGYRLAALLNRALS